MIHKTLLIVSLFCSMSFSASVSMVLIGRNCPYNVKVEWFGFASKGFNVYKSTLLFNTKKFIGSTQPFDKSFIDEAAMPNQYYYYWVEAVDNDKSVMSSTSAQVKVKDVLPKPSRPTVKANSSSIAIDWTYIDSEEGMYIYRSTNYGQYKLIKTINSSITSDYTDYDINQNNIYSYKISAFDDCGESELSEGSLSGGSFKLPDIAIDSVKFYTDNDSVLCMFIVVNIGTAICDTFNIGALNNNELAGLWKVNLELLPNTYLPYSFKFPKSALNEIFISADFSKKVIEGNEYNNAWLDTLYFTSNVSQNYKHSISRPELNQNIENKRFDILGRSITSNRNINVPQIIINKNSRKAARKFLSH